MNTLNALEEDIQTLARKIKRCEESPDPLLLKSNKLFWELEKEKVEYILAAWRGGKILCEGRGVGNILKTMGIQMITFAHYGDRAQRFAQYKVMLDRQGFPQRFCDRAIAYLAMCDAGDLPKPHIVFNVRGQCDAHWLVDSTMAKWQDVPVFNLDVPLNHENKPDLDELNFVADQVGEFVEWVEKKVPGAKYDEGRLLEIEEAAEPGDDYLKEIYQLVKHVPCPIAPEDAFTLRRGGDFYPNVKKGNEYLRILRDEIGERVATGKGPYPEERLRLLWATGANYYGLPHETTPCRLLLERKVAMPTMYRGTAIKAAGLPGFDPFGDTSLYGVKLSPFQKAAKGMSWSSWGGPAKRWIDRLLAVARDIGAHGIVQHLLIGCMPITGIGSMVAERAEKELGIPVLNIEGRQLDPDFMSQKEFDEIVSVFIDKCLYRAGKPRQ